MEIDKFIHSHSSANQFMANKSAWLYKYAFKGKFPTWGAMARGLTSEIGAYYILDRSTKFKERDSEKFMRRYFKKKSFIPNQTEEDNSIKIAENFVKGLQERQLTKVKSYQDKFIIEPEEAKKKYGLKYGILGYTDFTFDNVIVDTKAKARLDPIRAGEIRQQALYSKMMGKKCAILTATPKKYRFDDILPVDVEQGFEESIMLFKTIEKFMELIPTKEDAVKITPLNTDDWYFDDASRKVAKEIWLKNQ